MAKRPLAAAAQAGLADRLSTLLCRIEATTVPLFRDGEKIIDGASFCARATRLCQALAARAEPRWALACAAPQEFALALFALWYSGKRAVILPNTQPATLRDFSYAYDAVLDDAGVRALEREAQGGAAGTAWHPLAADARLDLYTSGSSGVPKRIEKSLAQLEAEVAVQCALWGDALNGATIIGTVPHHHIYGLLFRILIPLAAGGISDTALCVQPDQLQERLRGAGKAVIVATPAVLARLPDLIDLRGLRAAELIFSSGAPLPAAVAARYQAEAGRSPLEIYGSTETGGIAWRTQEQGTAWTPLPGVAVAATESGALLLRSPFLPTPEPLLLDDAVELRAAGRFELKGRLDRVLKIEGKRLSLPEMEERLQGHPWVAAARLVQLRGNGGRQLLGAVAVLCDEGDRQLGSLGRRRLSEVLRAHLALRYEAVLLPRRWRFPPALPHDARGKLTLDGLTALFAEETA